MSRKGGKNMATFRKVTLTWRELSDSLSNVLLPDEDIENLTLVKSWSLLIHTFRIAKAEEAPEEKPAEED